MGNCHASDGGTAANQVADISNQASKVTQQTFSDEHMMHVQHYLPPTFPINPVLEAADARICLQSWIKIQNADTELMRMGTGGRSGATFFFDDFYQRLFTRSRAFETYFGGNVRKRGQILLRIMNFITSLDPSNEEVLAAKLVSLGQIHRYRGIRPWQYSVLAEVLIESVMYCLGKDGDYRTATSWVQVLSTTLHAMLPYALVDQVVTTEFSQNFSAEIDTRGSTVVESEVMSEQLSRSQCGSDVGSAVGGGISDVANMADLASGGRHSSGGPLSNPHSMREAESVRSD